jgi:ATP/maltotriose-dependent transcriptional regulator MalT
MEWLPHADARWWKAAGITVTILGQRGSNDALQALGAELAALTVADADAEARRVQVIALARASVVLLFAGRYEPAAPLLARMDALFHAFAAPDPQLRARVGQALGVKALYAGDLEDAVRWHRANVAACDEAGDARLGCAQRANLGDILRQLGLHAEAASVLRACLDAATRMGMHGVAASAKQNLGVVCAALGAVGEAAALQRASIEMCRAHDLPRMEHIARAYLAAALAQAGDLDAAETNAAAAAEALAVAPPLRAHALAIAAQIALARRRPDEALARAKEATALLESLGGLEEGEVLVRLVHAEALDANGDREAARRSLAAAVALVTARAQKLADPEVRAAFVGAVAENARAVALHRAWASSACASPSP